MDEDGDEIILEGHDHDHHHHDDEYDEDDEDEDGWESDGDDDDEGDDVEGDVGDRLENIARALVGGEGDHDMLHLDDDREDGFIDDELDDEEDMEGDEDEDELDDEEAMMEEDFEDDEDVHSHMPWGWAEGDEAALLTRAHPRGTAGGWFTLSGAPREPPTFSKCPIKFMTELSLIS